MKRMNKEVRIKWLVENGYTLEEAEKIANVTTEGDVKMESKGNLGGYIPEKVLKLLIDNWGFSYDEAKDIVENEDLLKWLPRLSKVYAKGKSDGRPNYTYSGGL
jgi:hypothetical protein